MSLQVGQRVKHWREIRGISQLDLATRAEMDPAKLCRIEKGKYKPRAEEVEKLAAAMTLSMPEFYGAADEDKAS